MKKKIIFGCDSRGGAQSPYLTRWTLLSCGIGAIYLHKFHRSDSPEHHDHPWAFVSLILWRGYVEESSNEVFPEGQEGGTFIWRTAARRYPGMLLVRRATHRHRVVLINDKPAWTLVVRGPYVREWGFFTKAGWQNWREYFKEHGC